MAKAEACPESVKEVNDGLLPVPKPNEVLAVFALSYAKAPAPVATINCPSEAGAPKVSRSAKIALFNLDAVIEPANMVFVTVPESPVPTKVPAAAGRTKVFEADALCGAPCKV